MRRFRGLRFSALAAIAALLCLTFWPRAFAADAAPPLAGLPSAPGPHIAKLEALGDNSWLELGPPAPDPQWGRARGRAWTGVMPFAPSLGGAFLYGEGVHGWFDRETGRYMDGLWFYDLMAHRWITVRPGTDVRNPPELIVNEDGFMALPSGEPAPIAPMTHGYHNVAWDPVRRRFMVMPNPGVHFRKRLPSVAAFLTENKERLNRYHASPLMYDVDSGRWIRLRTPTASPRLFERHGQTLLYLSAVDRFFLRRRERTWLYDPAENRWTRLEPEGPPLPFGIDASACYDPKRNRVYIGGSAFGGAPGPRTLRIYDVAANRWIDPGPGGYDIGTKYGTGIAALHCDLANDVVVLVRHRDEDRGIFVYHIEENVWERVGDLPEAWPDASPFVANAFYAATLNVHIFHVAGDSRDNGRIFAYRYRRAPR